MSAIPRGPDARTAYLAALKERLIAKRDGGEVITPAARVEGATFTLAPMLAPPSPPEPEPVQSTQASPYGDMGEGEHGLPRPDDHHVELAGLASALSTVAERLGEVARALRGQ